MFSVGHTVPKGTGYIIHNKETLMSLCVIVPTKDAIYAGIESRSMLPRGNGVNDYIFYNDDTQKYYIINENTAIFCVGQNTFENTNKTFVEEMKEMNISDLSLDDMLTAINDKFSLLLDKDKRMDLCICHYCENGLMLGYVDVGWTVSVSRYIYTPTEGFQILRYGVGWAMSILEHTFANNPVEFLKKAFVDVYKARARHDYTVGGPVHIMKISKDGCEWIEKELIIE